MFSIQIDKILKRNDITGSKYIGCFASDQIPMHENINNNKYPHCMVVNTDSSTKAGSHWIAMYMETPHTVDYYDSLGVWPPSSPHIRRYLENFRFICYNDKQLQTDHSATCGMHAIYFLWKRCSGEFQSIDDMIKHFNTCQSKPDKIVYSFVHSLMKIT